MIYVEKLRSQSLLLNHVMPLAPFYTPWKHEKTSGFVIFLRSNWKDQWHEMGQKTYQKIQKQPPEVFFKKGVLRSCAKFTGKHMCQSFSLNKDAGLRPATLLKKRLWHRYFPVNFAKFLRTPFLQNTSGRLLLKI